MKIVIIGGTGLIGSKLVRKLTADGHTAVPAAPSTGVNTLTGEGLDVALKEADVVVDVSNSPSFANDDVLSFFTTSTTHLLAAEKAAGVTHHVALSVVGTERLPDSGYLRAKAAQEQLIENSGLPYSIVQATQFFEFVSGIADSATVDGEVRLSSVWFQPMAAEDVATALGRVAAETPLNGRLEIGGPLKVRMDEFIREALKERHDPRTVVTDPDARYFGALPTNGELVPGPDAELATTTYRDWVSAQLASQG
ncbi:SDR family oxidoreductase [Microlunatus panaciterrae]|uniref:Uncharacterized protein YbjT (DUF2867 family) n=1 Tax=Microlunatus panaciterrae TaxID=400768 RepID=A0ABS2RM24_9ACTN|nr:uncharacterized protein YbjT (DUF2867 family) [Microlunatus panaciterrae]